MNKNVSPQVRYGQPAQGKRHQAIAQIGGSYGNKAINRARTLPNAVEGVAGPKPYSAPLGNEVAKNVGKGGCGTGRVLYGQSGSQQQYGKPEGRPAPVGGRDALKGE
jgi:hypothetical protein